MASYPALLSVSTPFEHHTFPVRWRSTGVLNGSSLEDALALLVKSLEAGRDWTLKVTTHIEGKECSSLVWMKHTHPNNEILLTASPPISLDDMPLSDRFSVGAFNFIDKPPKTEYSYRLLSSPLLSSPLLSSPLLSSPRFYQKMLQLFLTVAPKKWNLIAFFRAFILLWVVGVHAIAFSEECPRPSTTGDLQPTKAEILYVNSQDGMVTLKHEGVPFLELPSNTGSYQIADDALLSYLKVGEKGWVSFIRRKTHLAIVEWQADACFKTPAKGP